MLLAAGTRTLWRCGITVRRYFQLLPVLVLGVKDHLDSIRRTLARSALSTQREHPHAYTEIGFGVFLDVHGKLQLDRANLELDVIADTLGHSSVQLGPYALDRIRKPRP